jgi:hypothetical protein
VRQFPERARHIHVNTQAAAGKSVLLDLAAGMHVQPNRHKAIVRHEQHPHMRGSRKPAGGCTRSRRSQSRLSLCTTHGGQKLLSSNQSQRAISGTIGVPAKSDTQDLKACGRGQGLGLCNRIGTVNVNNS